MPARNLSIRIAVPTYACTGAPPGVVWELVPYIARTYGDLYHARESGKDKRIGKLSITTVSDTPATLTRNRIVKEAQKAGVDVLVMLDSDQGMMFHEGERGVQDFFKSSFDFLCEHYDKGPCVIGAPYCGPPTHDHENMYVFRWRLKAERGSETVFFLDQFTREEAALLTGITEVAALPTGAIMYDMRCFDLIEPPYFKYEWKDKYEDEKGGTEDVQNTRDIGIAGQIALGYCPVYCNWDSPVGHWKPWCVRGRPKIWTSAAVADTLVRAIDKNVGLKDTFTMLPERAVATRKEQFVFDAAAVEKVRCPGMEQAITESPPVNRIAKFESNGHSNGNGKAKRRKQRVK